eukprot:1148031-Pelagomonas_calceolata.AAC.1
MPRLEKKRHEKFPLFSMEEDSTKGGLLVNARFQGPLVRPWLTCQLLTLAGLQGSFLNARNLQAGVNLYFPFSVHAFQLKLNKGGGQG